MKRPRTLHLLESMMNMVRVNLEMTLEYKGAHARDMLIIIVTYRQA